MTCTNPMPGVIVCYAPQGVYRRVVRLCPTCGVPRRMVVTWGGVWYSPSTTCLRCGDMWSDGERMERPFKRGWRKERISTAYRKWHEAMTPREYRRYVREQVRREFA